MNPIGQLIPKFYSARKKKKNNDKCLFEQGEGRKNEGRGD